MTREYSTNGWSADLGLRDNELVYERLRARKGGLWVREFQDGVAGDSNDKITESGRT